MPLITLLLLSSFTLVEPKDITISLDYPTESVTLNELELTATSSLEAVIEQLGNYDRVKVEEGFSNYFFDEYGLMLIINKKSETLHGLMIQLSNQYNEFSTTADFSGKLYVNTKKVNQFKGMSFMERLIKDITPRETNGYKLTGSPVKLKVDCLYKPGGNLQLVFVNFL